ncbi:MAG: alpha-hydroxy-acid oxidizing protein, partial [Alphaproteobacteria bacterium]|nr:alpha-hydroxy-acid oxidizing protein [Alphaproteobacteria bacterium]
ALHAMRAAVGPDFPLIYDGAIRSGTDVLRALAVGADFVMLGRAWHHGVAAFGAAGAAQVLHILCEGMKADMGQMAIDRPAQARGRLIEAT